MFVNITVLEFSLNPVNFALFIYFIYLLKHSCIEVHLMDTSFLVPFYTYGVYFSFPFVPTE